MMAEPLLYDVYSGAGEAAKGYMNAGFRVVGIDNKPQPRYCGDGFILMDALEFLERLAKGEFEPPNAIHSSPPCQGVSIMRNLPWLAKRDYEVLIAPTRRLLEQLARPWVLENVAAAKWNSKHLTKLGLAEHGMQAGWLCGTMFQLPLFFHRLFETSFFWLAPGHSKHNGFIRRGHYLRERLRQPWRRDNNWNSGLDSPLTPILDGHPSRTQVERVSLAKGIDWMVHEELSQAIPPAYTEFIGKQLLATLENHNG